MVVPSALKTSTVTDLPKLSLDRLTERLKLIKRLARFLVLHLKVLYMILLFGSSFLSFPSFQEVEKTFSNIPFSALLKNTLRWFISEVDSGLCIWKGWKYPPCILDVNN